MLNIKFNNLFKSAHIVNNISKNNKLSFSPLSGALLLALVNEIKENNILIITDNMEMAKTLNRILESSLLNPEFGIYPYENDIVSQETVEQKLKFFEQFYSKKNKIIVTSIKGLFDVILPENKVDCLAVNTGKTMSESKFIRKLNTFGYKRALEIADKGDFSVKGSIVDLFLYSLDNPLRFEFNEEKIEEIKCFDLATMRSVEKIKDVVIYPVSFLRLSDKELMELKENIGKVVGKNDLYLNDSIWSDVEEISKNENVGVNYYSQFLFNKGVLGYPSLVDFSQKFTKIYYGNVTFEKFLSETEEIYKKSVEADEIFPVKTSKIKDAVRLLSKGEELRLLNFPIDNTINLDITSIPENFSALSSLKDFILSYLKEKSVLIVTEQYERVKELLSLYELVPKYELSNKKGLYLLEGFLEKGIETENILILTDKELFPHYKLRKAPKKIVFSREISNIEELVVGDYVVHKDFGIGIFKGLKEIKQNGVEKEYMLIEYRNGEKLYVPMERIGLVQRYIGDRRIIALNRLHGAEWEGTKKKAAESARLLAMKMLRVEAERKLKGGFQFKPFPREEKVLVLSFPYEFTDDQQAAMEEVFKDMEKPLPMDRLICGDVGYGKTEIAIRAAFRAAMNGKQTAFLVPTTVLALQHERTLRERLHLFPVEIGMLSRFTSKKDVNKILRKLEDGTMDIVVGTHRVLSKDVKFKNLGLLIIDEEQKFGVRDKERIKEMKANIDLLTLTATPIPRTLHSALVNLKSISMINTPPPGRLPVKTFVMPFSWDVAKKAVEFELGRNGQVFVVHNRIESIYSFAEKLRMLVPNAKIAVAHGRMDKLDLEEVMLAFYKGDTDVLVSTTIIENGIDIPTVNTLLVDVAENFGLSQMYQLRGRIGRSHINAFAYFFFTPNKSLRAISEERLQTIKEFTGIGAGIKISMKDLELRGAGNILGKEQHGHIISVGYNMYVNLLEEAIAELKGEKKPPVKDAVIRVAEKYFIPSSFVPLNSERMDYYRRITNAIDSTEIDRIVDELIDRFGKLPREVKNLIEVGKCELIMRNVGVKEVFQEGKRIFFSINKDNRVSPKGLQELLQLDESTRFGKDYLSFEVHNGDLLGQIHFVLNLLRGESVNV